MADQCRDRTSSRGHVIGRISGWSAIASALLAVFGHGALAITRNINNTVTHDSGGGCSGGPTVSVDKPSYAMGETVNVTISCGPGNQKDWFTIIPIQGGASLDTLYVNGATNGTFPIQAPNVKSDRDLRFQAVFYANDSWQRLATSPNFTVQKTIVSNPTQFLPAHLAPDPFTPQHVSTVCLSGCDFTALGDAIANANNKGWDFVQIKVSAGEYPYPRYAPTPGGSCPYFPTHTWIKGISSDGVSFPHIFGDNASFGICSDVKIIESVTVDNVEFGPSTAWMLGPREMVSVFTLRNVYVHDTAQGLHTGAYGHNPLVTNFYNTVVSRSGGPNGPAHDVYAENDTLNAVNSVFEQPIIGHAFKTRATNFTASCSMFLVNQDNLYKGTETIDFSDGGIAHVMNSLSDSGAGAGVAWGNYSAWDNMRYGAEEGPPYTKPVNTPILDGNLLLRDDPNVKSNFFSLYMNVTPTPPVTWTNNRFVYAAPNAYGWGDNGGAVYYNDARGIQHGQIVVDSSNKVFTSRHDAGLPDVGSYPKGWRDFVPLMPAACTDPVGLVKIPNN